MNVNFPQHLTLTGSVSLSKDSPATEYSWTIDFTEVTDDQIIELLSNASSLRVRLQNKFRSEAIEAVATFSIAEVLESVPRISLQKELKTARESLSKDEYMELLRKKGIL